MNTQDAVNFLREREIPDHFYSIGGLGNGECIGITNQGGHWETYFSERGSKWDVREYPTESAACQDFIDRVQRLAKEYE